MEWKTRVTDMLGSRYPIIQGALFPYGLPKLAAAVSEAGGFGIITAGAMHTPEKLREGIRLARSLTDQPFGVNVSLGVSCPQPDKMTEAALEEGVKVVFTSVYNAAEHGKRIHAAGGFWIHKVATIKHALAAERQGADAVVIVGLEGAGEKSAVQLTTMTNMTVGVRRLHVPLIAAGGIGDGRSFLAALAMGAEAVYLGTAFMAAKESPLAQRYKEAMFANEVTDQAYRDKVFAPPPPELVERIRSQQGMQEYRRRVGEGTNNREARSMVVGVLDGVKGAGELVQSIITEAEALLNGAGPLGRILAVMGR